MRLSKGVKLPKGRGAKRLEAVFPAQKRREAVAPNRQGTNAQQTLEAVFGQKRKPASARPGVRVGMGLPVKLQERRGGGVEAVLRREMAHSELLSARDFQRLRFLLGRAERAARMQSPRGSGRRRLLQKRLAASWHTRLVRDGRGVSLVLENRSDHALYLAMGTRRIKPRAVFKSALASQQGAIDAEWLRLARLAQMRAER